MSVQRIIAGRSHTLSKTLYVGSTPTNPAPDSATALVTRLSDGTTFVPQVTDAGTGIFQLTLTPAQTATLDTLFITWTAQFSGEVQTYPDTVEVAADTYFTLAEARRVPALSDTNRYSDTQIVEVRTVVEDTIDGHIGFSFTGRYAKETITAESGLLLRLGKPYINAIRSVSVSGTALTSGQLGTVTFDDAGTVMYPSRWPVGLGAVTVGYEHGRSYVPAPVKRAALLLAKAWLLPSPIDDRATAFTSEEGVTYSIATPGRGGSITGIPDVDQVIGLYQLPGVY